MAIFFPDAIVRGVPSLAVPHWCQTRRRSENELPLYVGWDSLRQPRSRITRAVVVLAAQL